MHMFFWLLAAYMIGCVNGGYYSVKLKSGGDIRKLGSGNAGATNAGRLLGKRAFLAVTLFDAAKMLVALKLAAIIFPGDPLAPALTMLAVLLGHIFPAQLRFRGGQGIASLGGAAVYMFSPQLIVFTALVFLLLYAATRKYYRSGLAAIGILPVTYPGSAWLLGQPVDKAMCVSLAAGMVLIMVVSLKADRTVRDAAKRQKKTHP